MKNLPIARNTQIVTLEIENEVIVYDLINNKVHQLNETTNAVWRNCDGVNSLSQIARKENLPEEYVAFAVDKLQKVNLLANKVSLDVPPDAISRRKMLLKVGATAVALPLITSIVAPLAIHAASGCLASGQSFDITPTADIVTCVTNLQTTAITTCCSGVLNPAAGTFFTPGALCRGTCN